MTSPDVHSADPGPEHLLRAHPFVAGMSDEHLALLQRVCRATIVSFQPGYHIISEGHEADACYLIESGSVSLQVYMPGSGARTIETLGAGDVLGWAWLFPPYRWTADATALTPVQAIRLDGVRLRAARDQDPDFAYDLLRRFSQVIVDRLQATLLQLLDVYAV